MKTSNLALAFLLELCALAAISYWGYRLDAATALRWTIAIAAPLALALVWSQFAAPTARRRLQRAPLLAFKLVVFALAAVLLYSAGQHFELVTVHSGVAYVAGHAPIDGSRVLVEGAVGGSATLEDGYRAARLTGLSMIASLKNVLGDLDRVTRWLRAVGYVHAAPGFHENAKVVNGFSDLIVEVWGDAGRHARSAPGQGPSPLNVPIIVDALVALSE
jgi:enamine deaminase RidA (YjgF/YER057c/UK114 family)